MSVSQSSQCYFPPPFAVCVAECIEVDSQISLSLVLLRTTLMPSSPTSPKTVPPAKSRRARNGPSSHHQVDTVCCQDPVEVLSDSPPVFFYFRMPSNVLDSSAQQPSARPSKPEVTPAPSAPATQPAASQPKDLLTVAR